MGSIFGGKYFIFVANVFAHVCLLKLKGHTASCPASSSAHCARISKPQNNLQGGLVHIDPNSDAVKAWTQSLAKCAERPDAYQLNDQMRALLVIGEDVLQ
jgi:hypothetical protein